MRSGNLEAINIVSYLQAFSFLSKAGKVLEGLRKSHILPKWIIFYNIPSTSVNIVSLVLTHASNAETCHLIMTKEVLEVVVMLKDWITFKVLPAGDSLFLRYVTWKRGEVQHSSLRVPMYSAKIRKPRGKTVLRALLSGDDKTCWSFKSAVLKENSFQTPNKINAL